MGYLGYDSNATLHDSVATMDINVPGEMLGVADQMHSIEISPKRHLSPSETNALLPVTRLHQDVLIFIFQYAIDNNPKTRGKLAAIVITHVCHSWRIIALDNPHFWTKIDLYSGARCANGMVVRTKSLPISISFHLPRMYNLLPNLHRELFDSSRIKELQVHGGNDTNNNSNKNVDRLLRKFHGCSAIRYLYFRRFVKEEVPLDFPLSLFPNAPTLQHLQLKGCNVPWEYLGLECLAGLVFLSLEDCAAPRHMNQLRDILSVAKKLQSLTLDYVLLGHVLYMSLDTSPAGTTAPITLSKLTSYDITASVQSCVAIHAHISYPAGAIVSITIPWVSDDDLPLFPALLSHTCFSEDAHFTGQNRPALHIQPQGPGQLSSLHLGGTVHSYSSTRLRWKSMAPTASHLVSVLTVSRLRFLGLGDVPEDRFPVQALRSFFLRHPDISELKIETDDIRSIMGALRSNGDDAPLPELRSLTIRWRSYYDHVTGFRQRSAFAEDGQLQALMQCLTDRDPHAVKLGLLTVASDSYSWEPCEMDGDDFERLQGLVGEVVGVKRRS